MTKPKSAAAEGLEPHWKVRIVIPGSIIHAASSSEPVLERTPLGQLVGVEADWLTDEGYGDTLGHVSWSQVAAITWRWSS